MLLGNALESDASGHAAEGHVRQEHRDAPLWRPCTTNHVVVWMMFFGCFVLVYWFPPLGGGVFADGRVQEVRSPLLQALLGPFAALRDPLSYRGVKMDRLNSQIVSCSTALVCTQVIVACVVIQ